MTDPRDTARQWLAERIHDASCGCPKGPTDLDRRSADAILQAPGVEVSDIGGITRRVNIILPVSTWLPAHPIKDSTGGCE